VRGLWNEAFGLKLEPHLAWQPCSLALGVWLEMITQHGPAGSAMAKRRQAVGSGLCERLEIRGRCRSHRTAPILGRESYVVSAAALVPGEGWTGCTPQQSRLTLDLHGHPRALAVPVMPVRSCLAHARRTYNQKEREDKENHTA
jgi:hypothetical protein